MPLVHSIRRYIAPFFSTCRILRAPILVSVFAFLVLSVLPQTREVYRVLADDYTKQIWQIVLGFLVLLLASGFVWHCARQVTLLQRQHALGQSSVEGALLRWLPRLLAALIPLGAALGLYMAMGEARTTAQLVNSLAETKGWKEVKEAYTLIEGSPARLGLAAAISLGLVAVVLAATVARTWHKRWKYERPGKWLMGAGPSIASFAIVAACVAAFSFAPPSLAQSLGVVTIFGLFIVSLVVILSSLSVLGDRIGVPLIACLVAWAVLLAWADRNDNHKIELVQHDPKNREQGSYKRTAFLKDAFNNWYASRKDREHYKANGDPYPVFIVAAAGGGAYAAHYTATFLARLQDRCPSFAQHTFAISGVSGGSLGATVFASLAKQMAKNADYVECDFSPTSVSGLFETKVQAIFSADFLSPVLAVALFPDLLQRVLPWPIPQFDRAKAIDATLEAAWRRAMEPSGAGEESSRAHPLEEPFLDLWAPQRDDEAVPALLLNSTEVANGYRTIISPLPLGGLPNVSWGKLQSIYERLPKLDTTKQPDIRLSTAAAISARFPLILPAASIDLKNESSKNALATRIRLVDGGYVESSAVETANEVLQLLKGGYPVKGYVPRQTKDPEATTFKFYLIVLMGYEGVEAKDESYGETSVPLRTLISTWQSRSDQAFMRAYAQNCTYLDICHAFLPNSDRGEFETDVAAVFLNLRDFSLPLTWQLTEASRRIIGLHAGVPPRCLPGRDTMLKWTDIPVASGTEKEATQRRGRIVHALEENNCSACLLQYKLADRSAVPSSRYRCASRPVAPGAVGGN